MRVWKVMKGIEYDGEDIVAIYDNEEAADRHLADILPNNMWGEYCYVDEDQVFSSYKPEEGSK